MRFFDCLVGYFFLSGFHKMYLALTEDGSLPKATAKKVAASSKKPENLPPHKVRAVLRRDIKHEYFQTSPAAHASQALAPREVTLSSWLVRVGGEGGAHE
jgi:hypothetical protein